MTLHELVQFVDVEDVIRQIATAYPQDTNAEGYRAAFAELRATTPVETDAYAFKIGRRLGDDDKLYWHVNLVDDAGKDWAVGFDPWAKHLNRGVRLDNCDLTPAQIVGHILWELTFYGFTSAEAEEIGDDISGVIAQIEALGENPTAEDLASIGITELNPEDFRDLDD